MDEPTGSGRAATASEVEPRMNCLKAFPDQQTAEIQIRVAIMNGYNTLGTAEITFMR